jgi:hypothetical protein
MGKNEVSRPHEVSRPRSFTIAATGDILLHEPLWQTAAAYAEGSGPPYDFRPMFAQVRPILKEADVAICHMETPIDRENDDLSSYPVFGVPRQIAPALRHAGYDVCSTASNHSLDKGYEGVQETLRVLDSKGLRHAGTGRTKSVARRPVIVDVEGVRVALTSYTYGLNGTGFPAGHKGVVNMINARHILRDARRARQAGAEFVVTALHWGLEYQSEPTDEQSTLAQRLLRSAQVDLIVGHHAHVVQPIARFGRKFVVYGMGNFLSHQSLSCCIARTQDGVIVDLAVKETERGFRVRRVRYTPTWMQLGKGIVPVAETLRNGRPDHELRAALESSWDRTVSSIKALGSGRPRVAPSLWPGQQT